MEYTQIQLRLIGKKIPELRYKPEPTLDNAIVAFLKKYEVYVKPLTTSKRNPNSFAAGATGGAIAALAGPDVAGDAFIIQGQTKQTAVQEWTQWKQWALDHKEFPKFKIDFFNEVTEHNANIDKKLKDPDFQEEIKKILKNENKGKNRNLLIYLFVCFIFLFLVQYDWEENNDNSSLKPIFKDEKIHKYI